MFNFFKRKKKVEEKKNTMPVWKNPPPPPKRKMFNDMGGYNPDTEQTGDFATSMLIANATDNAALGYLAGGDLNGAIIGEMLNNDNTSQESSTDFGGFESGSGGGAGAGGSWDDNSSSSYDSGSDSLSSDSSSSSFD